MTIVGLGEIQSNFEIPNMMGLDDICFLLNFVW